MSRISSASVITGSEDDGRRLWLRLLIGAIGWGLLVVLIVSLAMDPSFEALHLAVFLVTAVSLGALLGLFAAFEFRKSLMRERALPVEETVLDPSRDSLGRPVEPPTPSLGGEIVLEEVEGRRRYLRFTG